MSARPTAEIVADLRAIDQYVHWTWVATLYEAANRLDDLERLVACEDHVDADLYEPRIAKQLADLFINLHRGGTPWSGRPLNVFERFMARPWRLR